MGQIKFAEVTATSLMPVQPPTDTSTASAQGAKAVVKKTAAFAPPLHGDDLTPEVMQGRVKVARWALDGQYPLDGYEQVKTAARYFDEHVTDFAPEDRRTFAFNLVKRASELAIPVSDLARDYGAPGYASPAKLALARDMRRNATSNEEALTVLNKIAEAQPMIPANVYCRLLGEFDERYGLTGYYGDRVLDPVLSTFGQVKQAEYTEHVGLHLVTETKLKDIALKNAKWLSEAFSPDFLEEFRKDPVAIFKSLPAEQKMLIARMARASEPGTVE